MSFFEDVIEIGEAFGELIVGLGEVAVESTQEFGELMTDGVKEIVIKGNDDYHTSFELKDEADGIISSARLRFTRASEEVTNYYDETKKLLEKHFNYKKEINNRILPGCVKNIRDFIKLPNTCINANLNFYSFGNDEINLNVVTSAFSEGLLIKSLKGLGNLNPVTFGLGFGGMIISQHKRKEESEEYLSEAKYYKDDVNLKVAKLKTVKSKLALIRKKIEEERNLIDNLIEKIKALLNDSFDLINRNEIDKAQKAIKIANIINITLKTQFIDEKGDISDEYNNISNELKQLEMQLN